MVRETLENLSKIIPLDLTDLEILENEIESSLPNNIPEVKIFNLPDGTNQIYITEIDPDLIEMIAIIKTSHIRWLPDHYYALKEQNINPLPETLTRVLIERYIDLFDRPITPPVIISDETGEKLVYESGAWGLLYFAKRHFDTSTIPGPLLGVIQAYTEWKFYEFHLVRRLGLKASLSEQLMRSAVERSLRSIDSTTPPIKGISISGVNITFGDPLTSATNISTISGRDELTPQLDKLVTQKRKKFVMKRQLYFGPIPFRSFH